MQKLARLLLQNLYERRVRVAERVDRNTGKKVRVGIPLRVVERNPLAVVERDVPPLPKGIHIIRFIHLFDLL